MPLKWNFGFYSNLHGIQFGYLRDLLFQEEFKFTALLTKLDIVCDCYFDIIEYIYTLHIYKNTKCKVENYNTHWHLIRKSLSMRL